MRKNRERNIFYLLIIGLFYLPVLSVLSRAFLRRNALADVLAFLKSDLFLKVLSFTTKQAVLSAAFSLLLAIPGAYFFGRYEFPGKRILRSVMVLPFMLPGILAVLGMVVFYGRNGALNHFLSWLFPGKGFAFTGLYGFKGIVLTHVFYNFSFCLRILGERWERIDPRFEDASFMLGAGKIKTWWRVTLPLLLPTIGYLFTLVFLYSFLSFTVVLVLGGYLYRTFEVLIYIEYNNKLNFDRASLLAGVQLLLLAGVLYLQNWTGKLSQRQTGTPGALPKLNSKKQVGTFILFILYLIIAILFFTLPIILVLIRSFKSRGQPSGAWTFENYRLLLSKGFSFAVGKSFISVLLTSITISGIVALLTLIAAYTLARKRKSLKWGAADLWLQLPIGISFLTFSFGLINLTGQLVPSWLRLIWAQFFLAFPLVYSILRTARQELGEDLLDAAALLGASSKEVFLTVELPLMRRALASALAYGAAISLGDLSAVLVLGEGKIITLSVAVYRLIGHYRFPQATALGTIFIILSLFLFFLIEGKKKRDFF
jgi:thiamine transport system permease protein